VYGGIPPDALIIAIPSDALQLAFTDDPVRMIGAGEETVAVAVDAQPSVSVMVTVYVPGESPVAVVPVCGGFVFQMIV
jgi:hypothetical protein